jgi:hypothetical protein
MNYIIKYTALEIFPVMDHTIIYVDYSMAERLTKKITKEYRTVIVRQPYFM